MNRIKFFAVKFVIMLLLLFSFQGVLLAQAETSKSSQIMQDVSGKSFYVHKVVKGENLFRLTQIYGTPTDTILKYNPQIKKDIKSGMEIKIPVPVVIAPKAPAIKVDEGFHKVEKGETAFSICKEYNISQEDLLKWNKLTDANLQIGQLLRVKAPQELESKTPTATATYSKYTIKPGDTYYFLEKNTGLKTQQLKEINPQLADKGLSAGMAINVPVGCKLLSLPKVDGKDSLKTGTNQLPDENSQPKNVGFSKCGDPSKKGKVYQIGLLIPLYLQNEKDIKVENKFAIQKPESYISLRFIEFYQAAQLAFDSLSKLGFKAEIFVWDTKGDPKVVDSICKLDEFKNLDLVLGPFYQKTFSAVETAIANRDMVWVDMFSTDAPKNITKANVFILKTTEYYQYYSLAKYINDSLRNSVVSILHSGTSSELKQLGILKSALQAAGVGSNVYDYRSGGFNSLMGNLRSGNTANVIFNLTTDEVKVSNFLRLLNPHREKSIIYLMALEKQWAGLKTLETEYLGNLGYTTANDYYVNYADSSDAAYFESKFYSKYGKAPGKIGVMGYDVSMYFGMALLRYGKDFDACLKIYPQKMLHTPTSFKSLGNGVYQNTKANVVSHKGFIRSRKN